MNTIPLEIRRVIYTPQGPAGHRLERGVPLPVKKFDFSMSPEDDKPLADALEAMQNYCNKYVIPKARK